MNDKRMFPDFKPRDFDMLPPKTRERAMSYRPEGHAMRLPTVYFDKNGPIVVDGIFYTAKQLSQMDAAVEEKDKEIKYQRKLKCEARDQLQEAKQRIQELEEERDKWKAAAKDIEDKAGWIITNDKQARADALEDLAPAVATIFLQHEKAARDSGDQETGEQLNRIACVVYDRIRALKEK